MKPFCTWEGNLSIDFLLFEGKTGFCSIWFSLNILFLNISNVHRDPTRETSELLPVKWTPISEDTLTYLDINQELTLGRRPFHDRMAFLDLFFDVNKHLLNGYEGNDG